MLPDLPDDRNWLEEPEHMTDEEFDAWDQEQWRRAEEEMERLKDDN